MTASSESWSTQQLVEFVALISNSTDEQDAAQKAIERAAEALEAEVCVLMGSDTARASIGFAEGAVPAAELARIVAQRRAELEIAGLGTAQAISAVLEGDAPGALVVARLGEAAFTQEEIDLLRGMARVLALTLRMLSTLDHERDLRLKSQHEVRQRKKAERELAHHALHDALTGLPNRSLMRDRATHAIERAHLSGALVVALFVDLDNFKVVNDSLGHGQGDQLLVALSRRLEAFAAAEAAKQRGCTVGRVGGDEFVLLCEEQRTERDAVVTAERLLDTLRAPLDTEGRQVALTASIGIATVDGRVPAGNRGVGADDLLRDADVAMSRAKESGRDRFEVFDENMRVRLLDRVELEEDLRAGVARGELRLVYQPVVGVDDASTAGVEALVRWQHPTRGLLGPASFITTAEESELIVALGQWVIGEACEQLARWEEAGQLPAGVRLSVNVSARQLRPALVRYIEETLARTGVQPERLALEITERLLIEQADSSGDVLYQLKALGVGLVLDDFGTGYSSLSYLRSFPLDQIKLDRSFTSGLVEDPRSAKIVSATIEMARALGMTVVAEGVENPEQLQVLQRLHCDYAQGYHFARPEPANELAARMERAVENQSGRSEVTLARSLGDSLANAFGPTREQDNQGRQQAVGRVAGLFFAAGGALTVPATLLMGGSSSLAAAVAVSLMALGSAGICLMAPWSRLSARWVHVTAIVATLEVLVTIATVGHAAVYSWFYVLIAAAAAYGFRSRRVLAGYTLMLAGATFLPLIWGGVMLVGDALARMMVGSVTIACTMAATAALRERLEAGQEELRELAVRDALTGVGNYRFLHDRLEYELRRHQRAGRQFALLLIDLDRFKQVNERHGHAAGDEALRRVARALSGAVRQQDTIARQGGDEFAVLAPETGPGEAAKLAERIRRQVGSVKFAGELLGATIGVALFPDDGGSAQVLLARADGRLIAEKNRGRAQDAGREPDPVGPGMPADDLPRDQDAARSGSATDHPAPESVETGVGERAPTVKRSPSPSIPAGALVSQTRR